jgi:hypothetical protein
MDDEQEFGSDDVRSRNFRLCGKPGNKGRVFPLALNEDVRFTLTALGLTLIHGGV